MNKYDLSEEEIRFKQIKSYEKYFNTKDIVLKDLNIINNKYEMIKFITGFNFDLLKKNVFKLAEVYFNKNSVDKEKIFTKIDNFYQKQHSIYKKYKLTKNTEELQKIYRILNLQFNFAKYLSQEVGLLTKENNKFSLIHESSIRSNDVFNTNEILINLIKKFISNYIKIDIGEYNQINKKQINDNTRDIIIKIFKDLTLVSNKLISYGSYTSYQFNNNIDFHDLDMYYVNSYYLTIVLAGLFYFVSDIKIDVFSIPYIRNHFSVKDVESGDLIVDCIKLDEKILKLICPTEIHSRMFIPPLYQAFNFFRMCCEKERVFKIRNNESKYKNILINLFSFHINNSEYSNLNIDDILKKLKMLKNKNELKHSYNEKTKILKLKNKVNTCNNIVVFFNITDNEFLEKTKNLNGYYTIKFFAFLNEIIFLETDNENNIINIYLTNNNTTLYFENKKVNLINLQAILSTITLISYIYDLSLKNHILKLLFETLNLEQDDIIDKNILLRLKPVDREHIVSNYYNCCFKSKFISNINYDKIKDFKFKPYLYTYKQYNDLYYS